MISGIFLVWDGMGWNGMGCTSRKDCDGGREEGEEEDFRFATFMIPGFRAFLSLFLVHDITTLLTIRYDMILYMHGYNHRNLILQRTHCASAHFTTSPPPYILSLT